MKVNTSIIGSKEDLGLSLLIRRPESKELLRDMVKKHSVPFLLNIASEENPDLFRSIITFCQLS